MGKSEDLTPKGIQIMNVSLNKSLSKPWYLSSRWKAQLITFGILLILKNKTKSQVKITLNVPLYDFIKIAHGREGQRIALLK